ncbi:MAG: hypothetical protein HeimC2_08830 [Candidatus Heimdallarchaeota archaeon LC_2]|nr:MAG: hypothetical protein HeimC2_08830 [Candidatus Heimdallarchaeota archaeon LC_2]
MNIIELSKSSRAGCRFCKLKIQKDEPRLGEEYEFSMGGSVRTGMRWFHLKCAIDNFPDLVIHADVSDKITKDVLEQLEEVKKKATQSAFAIQGISELGEEEKTVNVKGHILKAMKPKLDIDESGSENQSRTIYVEDNDNRRKIVLWNEHTKLKLEKTDKIVILKGLSKLGSDEKIMVYANKGSKVLINPKDEDLEKSIPNIEIFTSQEWTKPRGKFSIFELAKSSRATCNVCKEKIIKAELKIIKPGWGENEDTKQKFPSSASYHVSCIIKDENGGEVLQEALTRLTPEQIDSNRNIFSDLQVQLKDEVQLSEILSQLL